MTDSEFIKKLEDFVVIYKGPDGKTYDGFTIAWPSLKLAELLKQYRVSSKEDSDD